MSARDVLEAYTDRINRQDFDLLTGLIAPDATFWFTNGTHSGIAAIRAAFEATWQVMGPTERYRLDQLEWSAEGDEAGTDPERVTRRLMVGLRDACDLAEEDAEAGDDEAEAHHRKVGANPSEEGALGGETDSWVFWCGGHAAKCRRFSPRRQEGTKGMRDQ